MRHRSKGRKLGRTFQARLALLRNLALSLFIHEKIKTTEAKAKEVQRIVDKLLADAQSQTLASRRNALGFLYNNVLVVRKIYEDVVQRYDKSTTGGFTRIVKIGSRAGDNAPFVLLELTQPPVSPVVIA